MKKLTSMFILVLSLFSINVLAISPNSNVTAKASHVKHAENTVTLHFFWSKDCPHCVAAHPFLDKLKGEYPWLRVKAYEVSDHPRNGQLFERMARAHGKETSFVPAFFVGDKMIVGYSSAQTTGSEIRDAVNEAHKSN